MTGENWSYIRRMQSGIRLKKVNSRSIDSFKSLMERSSDILSKYSKNTAYEVFGIETGGEAAGIIALSPSDDLVEILWLLVDEDKRHQGYGSRLLIKAKEYARELGCDFVGGMFPDNVTIEEIKECEVFFLKNGFYRGDALSKGNPSVLCDLDAEIEDELEEDDDYVLDLARELEPLAAITVQKLQRLKGMLQEDGATCDIVLGEDKAFLWVQGDPFDLQISLLTRDSAFEVFFYTLSSFVESEADEEELKEIVLRINSSGSFITATASEGGIVLNYTLLECGFPIDERSFMMTYAQFGEEVTRICSTYDL